MCFRQPHESCCSMFARLHRNIPSNSQRWVSIARKPRTRPRLCGRTYLSKQSEPCSSGLSSVGGHKSSLSLLQTTKAYLERCIWDLTRYRLRRFSWLVQGWASLYTMPSHATAWLDVFFLSSKLQVVNPGLELLTHRGRVYHLLFLMGR